MADVLYLDYSDCAEKSKKLLNRLRTNKIDFDFIGDFIKIKGDISSHVSANAEFERNYYPKLGYYNVLIAHGGVVFNNQINSIQNKYPKLSIILISDFKNSLESRNGKHLICHYDAENLVPFIKEQLEKVNGNSKK